MRDNKKDLEKIHNEALCYWSYQAINSFIHHMLKMYGESWETSLSLIRVQDQSKYFGKIFA